MYRLFVALDFPAEVREKLAGLGFGIPGAKWVPEEQIHLTLRFIGEVDGGVFRDIKESLSDIRSQPFFLNLKGLGYFPPRGEPRVLWAGVEKNEALSQLKKRLDSNLARIGIPPEKRKFSPHVTLARLKNTPVPRLANFLSGNGLFASYDIPVAMFHLYSSFLTPKGAIHQCEASYNLEA